MIIKYCLWQEILCLYALAFSLNISYEASSLEAPSWLQMNAVAKWVYGYGIIATVPVIIMPYYVYRTLFFAFSTIVIVTIGIVAEIQVNHKMCAKFCHALIIILSFVQIDTYFIITDHAKAIENERIKRIEFAKDRQRLNE